MSAVMNFYIRPEITRIPYSRTDHRWEIRPVEQSAELREAIDEVVFLASTGKPRRPRKNAKVAPSQLVNSLDHELYLHSIEEIMQIKELLDETDNSAARTLWWGLDSCASNHITCDSSLILRKHGESRNVLGISGAHTTAEMVDFVNMESGLGHTFSFTDCCFMDGGNWNILSLNRFLKRGFTVSSDFTKLYLPGSSDYLPILERWKTYYVQLRTVPASGADDLVDRFEASYDWCNMSKFDEHLRLNHTTDYPNCPHCLAIKGRTKPVSKSNNFRGTQFNELVSCDLIGPFSDSVGGSRFCLTIVDSYTRWTMSYPIKRKSDWYQGLMEWQKRHGNPTIVRSDNGGEFTGAHWLKWCRDMGARVQYSSRYTPQQNGWWEAANKQLVTGCKLLLAHSRLPREYWSFWIQAFCHAMNRLPRRALGGLSSYELKNGRKPSLKHLRTFGASVYYQDLNPGRKKLDDKFLPGIFLGYSPYSAEYWVEDATDKKIRVSRTVKFLGDLDKENDLDSSNTHTTVADLDFDTVNNALEIDASIGFRDDMISRTDLQVLAHRTLVTTREALNGADEELWKAAMHKEEDAVNRGYEWVKISDMPPGVRPLPSRYVLEVKADGRYKARIVWIGFLQSGWDEEELYSPVARLETFRTLMSLWWTADLEVEVSDVDEWFMQSPIPAEDNVYLTPPKEFSYRGHEDKKGGGWVWRMTKSIYGLRKWSRYFNEYLDGTLWDLGWKHSKADRWMYTHDSLKVVTLSYVDDLLFIGEKK